MNTSSLPPEARAWREVDLAALHHNAEQLCRYLAPGQELMAVVKADAYGHGATAVAQSLCQAGINAFAVACLEEGITLRQAGIQGTILILGYTRPEESHLLCRHRLTQAVADSAHGLALAAQGHRVHVHLALDTGMHRLGIPATDHAALLTLFAQENLVIDGVFSHLCVVDSPSHSDTVYTQKQLDSFYQVVAWLRNRGLDPGAIHIQASYGLLNLPPQPCRYARAGILLYGVYSDPHIPSVPIALKPVLSIRARVATVRHLDKGDAAGYGLAFHATGKTKLAVATIGYGDGLPRALAQRGGQVLLQGRRCPMVGHMCMDQLLIDVTAVENVHPGDVVTIIGRDGQQEIHAEDIASQCGTITNELLSRLGSRLPLTYFENRASHIFTKFAAIKSGC